MQKILLPLFVSVAAAVNAAELHVSPDGSDSNPGTRGKPFLTLEKAASAARLSVGPEDAAATVILHEGTYRLSKSLAFDERDSNTTYRSGDGEEARITGGVEVSIKDLKPVKDEAVLNRLPVSSRAKVLQLVMPGKGSSGSAGWPLRFRGYAGWPEVYIGGRALRLARWPNDGYAAIAKVLDKGSVPRQNQKPDRGGRFEFKEPNPTTWAADEPIYLGGYWCYKWYDEFVRVASIDSGKKQITMAAPHQYGLGGPSKGLYFAINLLEELDQPGEYVYDGRRNTLYMLLPDNVQGAICVSALHETLVVAKKAKNMKFRGLIFENGCANGINISDCESIRIEDCTIRQISGVGVTILNGRDCGIDSCTINAIGKTGVRLAGGDRQTLSPARHFVTNSRIYNFARLVKTYCPAVGVKGVGQTVSHNHFHDAPHAAVIFHGNDHQIMFNHIESVCLDTADAGAIYCGRDWTLGGNRVHGNYIHDLGRAAHNGTWGIYLDDMSSGVEVSSNLVADTGRGFLIGGGRSNVIIDNVIVNCRDVSIRFDARGVGWAGKSRGWLNKPDGIMWKRLDSVPCDTGIWRKRFPYLAEIDKDAYKEPRRNVLTGNRIFKSPDMRLDKLVIQHGDVKDNHVSDTLPEIVLKNGHLEISDASLKAFESVTIGPAAAGTGR